jgi:hypothetical protein
MDTASPEDFVSGRWKHRVGYADAAALRWEMTAQADHAARLAALSAGHKHVPACAERGCAAVEAERDAARLAAEHPGPYRPTHAHEYRLPQWEARR